MLVTPKRNGAVSVDQVGAVQETLQRWERATSCRRTRWLYNAPHPSISDTSMWDKSIMCLWKLIWKLAACWGLENVANAFLCWGIILKVFMGPMDLRRFLSCKSVVDEERPSMDTVQRSLSAVFWLCLVGIGRPRPIWLPPLPRPRPDTTTLFCCGLPMPPRLACDGPPGPCCCCPVMVTFLWMPWLSVAAGQAPCSCTGLLVASGPFPLAPESLTTLTFCGTCWRSKLVLLARCITVLLAPSLGP